MQRKVINKPRREKEEGKENINPNTNRRKETVKRSRSFLKNTYYRSLARKQSQNLFGKRNYLQDCLSRQRAFGIGLKDNKQKRDMGGLLGCQTDYKYDTQTQFQFNQSQNPQINRLTRNQAERCRKSIKKHKNYDKKKHLRYLPEMFTRLFDKSKNQIKPKTEGVSNPLASYSNIREDVLEWILNISNSLDYCNRTVMLAYNLIDLFCVEKDISSELFHLITATALLIASKYEEVKPIGISALVYICKNKFFPSNIIEVEHHILEAIGFDISRVLIIDFFYLLNKVFKIKKKHFHFGIYLMFLLFLDFNFSCVNKCYIALAIHILISLLFDYKLSLEEREGKFFVFSFKRCLSEFTDIEDNEMCFIKENIKLLISRMIELLRENINRSNTYLYNSFNIHEYELRITDIERLYSFL